MKYFNIWEILDKTTYSRMGDRGWSLFNPDLLYSLDGLRDFVGSPISINTWWQNTDPNARQFSGYRPPECTIGAIHSEHRKGNAADCHVAGYLLDDYDKLRQRIMDNKDDERLSKIMRLEDGVNWLHLDCGQIPEGKSRIYLFKA